MTKALSFDDISERTIAKIKHLSQLLTREEMANIAGVSQRDVELFESNNGRISPIIQRKLLREYEYIIEGKNESPS